MKKILIASLSILILTLTACTNSSPTETTETPEVPEAPAATIEEIPVVSVNDDGYTDFDNKQLNIELSEFDQETLSEIEKEGLLYMREEEKLAHDVYAFLYEKWGQKIFTNIASSEQTHTDAVKSLLDQYSIDDPSTQTKAGEFQNEDLQALYDQLVAQGEISLIEALKVGITIEEVDIVDIQKYIKDVDNEDIILVYENLMRGSRNHLRAFAKNLNNQGESYTAEYLSEEEYEAIIAEEVEKGNGGFGKNKK